MAFDADADPRWRALRPAGRAAIIEDQPGTTATDRGSGVGRVRVPVGTHRRHRDRRRGARHDTVADPFRGSRPDATRRGRWAGPQLGRRAGPRLDPGSGHDSDPRTDVRCHVCVRPGRHGFAHASAHVETVAEARAVGSRRPSVQRRLLGTLRPRGRRGEGVRRDDGRGFRCDPDRIRDRVRCRVPLEVATHPRRPVRLVADGHLLRGHGGRPVVEFRGRRGLRDAAFRWLQRRRGAERLRSIASGAWDRDLPVAGSRISGCSQPARPLSRYGRSRGCAGHDDQDIPGDDRSNDKLGR